MTVVKIAGKLVGSIGLVNQIALHLEESDQPWVLVAGGGKAADLVRAWHQELKLTEEDCHWLAIRAMSLQADLLGRRLGMEIRHSFSEVDPRKSCVFDPTHELSSSPTALPVGWHVTSDSISAWVARRLSAQRLVLVKSVGDDLVGVEAACKAGWVDPYFRTVAAGIHVEWRRCDILEDSPTEGCIRARFLKMPFPQPVAITTG